MGRWGRGVVWGSILGGEEREGDGCVAVLVGGWEEVGDGDVGFCIPQCHVGS